MASFAESSVSADTAADTAPSEVSIDTSSGGVSAETPSSAETSAEGSSPNDVAGSAEGEGSLSETAADGSSSEEIAGSSDSDDVDEPAAPPAPPARKALRLAGHDRLDGIAAVVGDEIILFSEVDAYVFMFLASRGIKPEDADLKKVVELCVEDLIDNKVMLVRAKNDSTINVRTDEVESTLNNHINLILRQNNITMEQLELQLRVQQGTTMTRFKAEARRAIREQLLKQKLQQGYLFGTQVNRRDVERFYEEYRDSLPEVGESFKLLKLSLRVAATDSLRQAAFDRINAIKRELDAGKDFAETAIKYSESPEGKSGGDLGYLVKGSTTEITLEERAFNLPVGKASEPFETRLGYHIILVEEKRDRRVKLRQIFIANAPTEHDRQRVAARLDSLRTNVKTAAAFEEAARSMSVDQVTRAIGGDMGWQTLLALPPTVRTAVQELENGQISAPVVEDNNIMTIYMAVERVDSRRLTLENDYTLIADKARDIAAQKKLIEVVRSWRGKVFIDVRI